MKKALSDRLELLISTMGIKKQDFSRKIQFSAAYVSRVLSGDKTSPSERFFSAVCREFNVSPEWIRDGKGEMLAVGGKAASPIDAEIMAKFRILPPQKKKVVEEIINAFVKNIGEEGNVKKTRKA